MSFNFRALKPTRTQWLETRVRYTGRGRAVFTDPPGVIEGAATVTFTRGGRAKVRLTPDRVEPDSLPLHLGHSRGEYRRNGMQNPCSSVEVRTEAGVFSSIGDRVFLGGGSHRAQVGQALDLDPLRAEFVAPNELQAAFWVLPLTNFVTDDWAKYFECSELAQHPLRLFTTPQVPPELVGDERDRALHIANSWLLAFDVGDRPGFIEQLPGYAKRVKRLTEGESRNEFTAVAVGPALIQNVVWGNAATLFPIDVLALLNLSTGTRVGAPWVEFRNADGKLVRRCHIPFGASSYRPPRPAIKCYYQNAIGALLTSAFASPEFGKSFLRVVLHHACAAAERGTQETQFLTICRAFETLCHEHKLQKQNLGMLLTEDQRKAIARILDETRLQVRALADGETDGGRKDAVGRIAERVLSAPQQDRSFGLAVRDLATQFGFHDAAVLDSHFGTNPSAFGSTWGSALSTFRGAATHEAYFDIGGRHDLWEIQRIKDHLHDLLLRIIWKIVGYSGPYYTPIPPGRTLPGPDWVTPTTTPRELGFA